MKHRKLVRALLGIGLASVFAWLMLRHLDTDQVTQVMGRARPHALLLAVGVLCLGYLCRIVRWHTMLARINPRLKSVDCAGPLLASFAANNVLPFRAGDVMRAFVFNDRLQTTSGTVMATLLVERLLDLLMVVLLLAAALAIFPGGARALLGLGLPALLAVAAAILAVLHFPQLFSPVLRLLDALAVRMPAAVRVRGEIQRARDAMQELAAGSTLWPLLAWSLSAWLAEGCVYLLVASAMADIVSTQAAWLALPVGTLATLIPSTPGYVGTFDYFTAQAMLLGGNGPVAAAAFAFLVHLVLWLPPTVAGGLYLIMRPPTLGMPKERVS